MPILNPISNFMRQLLGEPIIEEVYAPQVYAIVESPVQPEDPSAEQFVEEPTDNHQVTLLQDVFPNDKNTQFVNTPTPDGLSPDTPEYVKTILRILIDAFGSGNSQGSGPSV